MSANLNKALFSNFNFNFPTIGSKGLDICDLFIMKRSPDICTKLHSNGPKIFLGTYLFLRHKGKTKL